MDTAVPGNRKTLTSARVHIDQTGEHVRMSRERVESGKNHVLGSLVRVARSTSPTFHSKR